MQVLERSCRERFPRFGRNKLQEVERLVFEIAARDKVAVADVLDGIPRELKSFAAVKGHLLRARYPEASARGISVRGPMPEVDIDPSAACDVARPLVIYPKKISIEQGAEASALAGRMHELFPGSSFEVIRRYKDAAACLPAAYNARLERFFVVREQYDLFKPCPCTPGAVLCGYHNVNLGFGCPFECSYCFLQSYTNAPGIVFPANIDDFFKALPRYAFAGMRIGSGETTDSLAFDTITGFAPRIVEGFREFPQVTFEFKTKSDNISGLLSVKASPNIVAAWSVNPQAVIDREEFRTASLARRLEAARRCAAAGYRTAFHFDPVFRYPGWQEDYSVVVDDIFRAVAKDSIAWISLGTLRMTAAQKKMIENRFPQNTILSAELAPCAGKVRYFEHAREEVYRHLLSCLRAHGPDVPVYLCMETVEMWRRAGLDPAAMGFGMKGAA